MICVKQSRAADGRGGEKGRGEGERRVKEEKSLGSLRVLEEDLGLSLSLPLCQWEVSVGGAIGVVSHAVRQWEVPVAGPKKRVPRGIKKPYEKSWSEKGAPPNRATARRLRGGCDLWWARPSGTTISND